MISNSLSRQCGRFTRRKRTLRLTFVWHLESTRAVPCRSWQIIMSDVRRQFEQRDDEKWCAHAAVLFFSSRKNQLLLFLFRSGGADRCSTSYTIGKLESWNSNACNDTARRCHAITHRSLMSRWWMDPCYLIDNSETRRKNGMLPCIGEYLRLGSVCTDSRKCRPLRMLLFIGGNLVLSSLLAMRSTSFYKRYFVHS